MEAGLPCNIARIGLNDELCQGWPEDHLQTYVGQRLSETLLPENTFLKAVDKLIDVMRASPAGPSDVEPIVLRLLALRHRYLDGHYYQKRSGAWAGSLQSPGNHWNA